MSTRIARKRLAPRMHRDRAHVLVPAVAIVCVALASCQAGEQAPAAPSSASQPTNVTISSNADGSLAAPPQPVRITGERSERLLALARAETPREPRATRTSVLPPPPGLDPSLLVPAAEGPTASRTALSLAAALLDVSLRVPPRVPDPGVVAPVDDAASMNAQRLYAAGRAAALQGHHLVAVTKLQEAAALDPTSPNILRALARSFIAVNNLGRAIDAYERLLAIDPDDTEALYSTGVAAANRRQLDEAASRLGTLLHGTRSMDVASRLAGWAFLSDVLRQLGYDRAMIEAVDSSGVNDLELELMAQSNGRIASVARDRGDLLRSMGDAHCRLGEYAQAAQAYERAARFPQPDATALATRRIYAHLRQGRPLGAQQAFFESTLPAGPTDRHVALATYLAQHAGQVDALADAIEEQSPGWAANPRAARVLAALRGTQRMPVDADIMVVAHPDDLDAVSDQLRRLAAADDRHAVQRAIALCERNPARTSDIVDRLAFAVPNPATLPSILRSMDPAPIIAAIEGRIQALLGMLGPAWETLARAREQWPVDQRLLRGSIEVAATMNEPRLLKALIDDARDCTDPITWMTIARAHRILGHSEEALAAATRAGNLAPEDADVLTELARAMTGQAAAMAIRSAQQEYSNAGAASPVVDPAAVELAKQAVVVAEQAIERRPGDDAPFEVLLALHGPRGTLKDDAEFRRVGRRMVETVPNSRYYMRLLAEESLGQRRYEEAVERLVGLAETSHVDAASLRLLVEAWERWERPDLAEQWLAARLDAQPGNPLVLEQWTRVKLAQREFGAVRTRIETLLAATPEHGAARQILEITARQQGRTEEARRLAQQRIESRPHTFAREIERARLFIEYDDRDAALECAQWLIARAAEADRDELERAAPVFTALAEDDVTLERLTLDYADRALAAHPDCSASVHTAALRAIARLDGPWDRFDAIVRAAAQDSRDAAGPSRRAVAAWREIAQALVDSERPAAAGRAIRVRLLLDPGALEGPSIEFLTTLSFVADAAAGASETSRVAHTIEMLEALDAEGVFERLTSEDGSPATIAELLFNAAQVYSVIGDRYGSERLYARVLESKPAHPMAGNNLGYALLSRAGSESEATRLITQSAALLPNDAAVLDSLGWLRYMEGRVNDEGGEPGAVALLEQALAASAGEEPSPEVLEHLGDAYHRAGRPDDAAAAWRRALDLLEQAQHRQAWERNIQLAQSQLWGLVVVDPGPLYDREFRDLRTRLGRKVRAQEQGGEPEIALTFRERALAQPPR